MLPLVPLSSSPHSVFSRRQEYCAEVLKPNWLLFLNSLALGLGFQSLKHEVSERVIQGMQGYHTSFGATVLMASDVLLLCSAAALFEPLSFQLDLLCSSANTGIGTFLVL